MKKIIILTTLTAFLGIVAIVVTLTTVSQTHETGELIKNYNKLSQENKELEASLIKGMKLSNVDIYATDNQFDKQSNYYYLQKVDSVARAQ